MQIVLFCYYDLIVQNKTSCLNIRSIFANICNLNIIMMTSLDFSRSLLFKPVINLLFHVYDPPISLKKSLQQTLFRNIKRKTSMLSALICKYIADRATHANLHQGYKSLPSDVTIYRRFHHITE